jgi:hypothetical protein
MNAPMTHDGDTFYQSGIQQNERGEVTATILQVVSNPPALWWAPTLPYLSCGIVGVGLLVHFGMALAKFLESQQRRRMAALLPAGSTSTTPARSANPREARPIGS